MRLARRTIEVIPRAAGTVQYALADYADAHLNTPGDELIGARD
jgi:hypothetical protein